MSRTNTHQHRRHHIRKHNQSSGAPRRLGLVSIAAAILAIGETGHAQHAAFEVTPIVRMGETLPGSDAPIWFFHPPIINEAGQVAAITSSGLMLSTDGTVESVPLTVPGYLTDYDPDTLLLNNAGQLAVVFHAASYADNPLNGDWLLFHDGQTTHVLMKPTDPTPSGDGTLEDARDPSINDAGQVAFTATIHLNGSTETRTGLFIATPDGLTEVARTQDPAPDGGGDLIGPIKAHSIDELGRVTFVYGYGTGLDAIARGDGGMLELVVAQGQPSPRGGTVTSMDGTPAFNGLGHVLFRTIIIDSSESFWALMLADDEGLHELVLRGDPTPDDSTIFASFAPATLDDDGRAAFHAAIGPFGAGSGAYRYDGEQFHTIAQSGDHVPGYAFWNLLSFISHNVFANDLQQGAITWRSGWGGPEMGLWARDALDDLHPVIELGRFYDFAPGESYRAKDVTLRTAGVQLPNGAGVLNSQRDIAFRLTFDNELSGIFVARLEAADSNHNGIPDAEEIAADPSIDANGDGVLDSCQYSCPADITGPNGWPDSHVDGLDLLMVLSQWGSSCWGCDADLNNDGIVNVADLLALLTQWGPCDI